VVEVEDGLGLGPHVMVTMRRIVVLHAYPFIGFTRVVQPEVIVDCLGRQYRGKAFGQRLQAVERTVASNSNQSFDAELRQARCKKIHLLLIIRIHVIPR
jgi:hypothetical protein